MKNSENNIFQKIFAGLGFGSSSRVPLRSNIFNRGGGRGGYSPIGQTGTSRLFDSGRESPLLGNAQPSNRLSGFYERIIELKSYQLLDISKLAVNFFSDYIVNFLSKNSQEVVTILNEDGSNNEVVSQRINDILTKDLKIFDFIRDHLGDYIYFGGYYSMLCSQREEDTGHLVFRTEELYDPISVVIKKKKNKDGVMEEIFLARGDDGSVYEIPQEEVMFIGNPNLRLINDLEEGWKENSKNKPKLSKTGTENRDKVLVKESYVAGEPIFYASIIKVKELVIKELLISLLSLRDLVSPSLFGLSLDKSVPIETANELVARLQKMTTNYSELSSFLSAQFDATSFIESALTQNVKFYPDYNQTIASKNSLLPLDKLSDKLIDLMQNLDSCRNSVLSPLGIPPTVFDNSSGSKWQVLQQSERANSRIAGFMSGIKDSMIALVLSIYKTLYNEDLDPANITLHITTKTTVEYNNQINTSESINGLVTGITNILQGALQTLDLATPLLDPQAYLGYIQNLIKDIDPNTDSLMSDETIAQYIEILNAKARAQLEQMGVALDGGGQ